VAELLLGRVKRVARAREIKTGRVGMLGRGHGWSWPRGRKRELVGWATREKRKDLAQGHKRE
jgi:hypothetical protein